MAPKIYHASAYSFRHAKATELKNSDYDKENSPNNGPRVS